MSIQAGTSAPIHTKLAIIMLQDRLLSIGYNNIISSYNNIVSSYNNQPQ